MKSKSENIVLCISILLMSGLLVLPISSLFLTFFETNNWPNATFYFAIILVCALFIGLIHLPISKIISEHLNLGIFTQYLLVYLVCVVALAIISSVFLIGFDVGPQISIYNILGFCFSAVGCLTVLNFFFLMTT